MRCPVSVIILAGELTVDYRENVQSYLPQWLRPRRGVNYAANGRNLGQSKVAILAVSPH